MTSKTNDRSTRCVHYDGFYGIDRSAKNTGKGTVSDIVNFRIVGDGSLKKRSGFSFKTTLVSRPRALYPLDDRQALLLAGKYFGVLNAEDMIFSSISTVTSTSGNADIFRYNGEIYLLDGEEIYVYRNGTLEVANGYAPLYGKDWDPTAGGAVNEKRNLIGNSFRISYVIGDSSPSRFFSTIPLKSIDGVYVNGRSVATSRFVIEDGRLSIENSFSLNKDDKIVFYLTADDVPVSARALKSCTKAEIFGKSSDRGADPASVAFYRGEKQGCTICTRHVSHDEYDESSKIYRSFSPIYVTEDDILPAGDGSSEITASCRRGSRLLVFTARETFFLAESDRSAYLFHLSSSGGCSAKGAAMSVSDSPVTVALGGILKWSPISYDGDEYVAEYISDPIVGIPSESFFSNAITYHYRKTGELLFHDSDSADHRTFVYNERLKCWYCYDGFSADGFFELGDKLGFFSDRNVYLFDDSLGADVYPDAIIEFVASLTVDSINFGGVEERKRLCRLKAQINSGKKLMIDFTDAYGELKTFYLADRGSEIPGFIDSRLSLHRSRYYTAKLTSYYGDTDTIYFLSLIAAN